MVHKISKPSLERPGDEKLIQKPTTTKTERNKNVLTNMVIISRGTGQRYDLAAVVWGA
jgi:hypothetical protein